MDYVHKRTGKHAVIVKQDPEPKKEEDKPKEEKKDDGTAEKKGESKDGAAEKKGESKDEKKDAAAGEAKPDGGVTAAGGGGGEDMNLMDLKRNEYYYYHQPQNFTIPASYTAESAYGYAPAPQMFSDENPNACTVM